MWPQTNISLPKEVLNLFPQVIMLPGSSNPEGSPKYKRVYAAIEQESARCGFNCHTVPFPGHGTTLGKLNYKNALEAASNECRRIEPAWLIARSFGCLVAAGVCGSADAWVGKCRGVVFWGPFFKRALHSEFGTPSVFQVTKENYRKCEAFLTDDYFATLPEFDRLIASCRCNVRLARGTEDDLNTRNDLREFGRAHQLHQRGFVLEIVEVEGAKHSVDPAETSTLVLAEYARCLFEPFRLNRG